MIIQRQKIVKGDKGRTIKICVCKCDVCNTEFSFSNSDKKRLAKQFHFCSRTCILSAQKPDGLLFVRNEKMWVEKYGVKNPYQAPEKKEKIKQTNLTRYGVENTFQSEEKKALIRQTCLDKYGVDHPQKSKQIRDRVEQTNIERIGVKSPLCLPEVHKAGVKIAATQEVRKKALQTILQRYGTLKLFTLFGCHTASSRKKAYETMKKNGKLKSSKIENEFFVSLCSIFNLSDIERQKYVNRWFIDFYVKSIDTHIQFDGVYWHGLDRDISEISKHKHARDSEIEKSWYRDQKRFAWFKDSNLKLVRITDLEFTNSRDEVMSKLKELT